MKRENKGVDFPQGLKEVIHRERAILAHLPNEQLMAEVHEGLFDVVYQCCSESTEPSHSDVHEYVIVCSWQYKRAGVP